MVILRITVNNENIKRLTGYRKWPRYVYTIYLHQICIGSTKIYLLDSSVEMQVKIPKYFVLNLDMEKSYPNYTYQTYMNVSEYIQYFSHHLYANCHSYTYTRMYTCTELLPIRVQLILQPVL